jgi:hypothetical protein
MSATRTAGALVLLLPLLTACDGDTSAAPPTAPSPTSSAPSSPTATPSSSAPPTTGGPDTSVELDPADVAVATRSGKGPDKTSLKIKAAPKYTLYVRCVGGGVLQINTIDVGNKVSTPCDQVPSRHQVITDAAEETLTVSAPANATWTLVVASPKSISTG